MYADTPEEVCLDNLSLAYFGDEGLGRTILGLIDNINSFTSDTIAEYRTDYYNADNIVISFSGNIDESVAVELVVHPLQQCENGENRETRNNSRFIKAYAQRQPHSRGGP